MPETPNIQNYDNMAVIYVKLMLATNSKALAFSTLILSLLRFLGIEETVFEMFTRLNTYLMCKSKLTY